MRKSAINILFLLVFLGSCATNSSNDLEKQILENPAKNLSSFSFDPTSTITSRIQETPDFIIDYLQKMDGVDNYMSYNPTEGERAMFKEYLPLIPSTNLGVLQDKLIGIYFVENLLGSALADYVLDENLELYNILIINPETMKHTMTEWLSYRENSCFADSEESVQVDCGEDYTGLLYVLLHETTHFVDYKLYKTPYTEYTSMKATRTKIDKQNIFLREIWNEYSSPQKKYQRDFTGLVHFYGLGDGAQLTVEDAEKIYEELLTTPFNSLYASMSWAEDYAELVTWYHYTQVLHQPYRINLSDRYKLVRQFSPMENELVRNRFSIARDLYE